MAFTIKPSDIVSKSAKKYKMLLIFIMCPIVVGPPSFVVITGVSHKDVLLPCSGSYNGEFRFHELVVTWQRSENSQVVHSFFEGRDHPQYQENEFKERTQLFPEEFQKGNASLLLKNLRPSDAGKYTCYYILDANRLTTPQELELKLQADEMYNADKDNNILLYVLIPVGFLLLIICAIILVTLKKWRKAKPEGTPLPGQSEAVLTKTWSASSESGVSLQSEEHVGTPLRGLAEVALSKRLAESSDSGVCWRSDEHVGAPLLRLSEAELTKTRSASFESGVCLQSEEHVGAPLLRLSEAELTKTRSASFESGVCLQSEEHVGAPLLRLSEAELTKTRSASFESGVCLQSEEHVGTPLLGMSEAKLTKTRSASFESGVSLQSKEDAKIEAYREKSPKHQRFL